MLNKIDKTLRDEFPIFKNNIKNIKGIDFPLVYLDSAVSTHKPQVVIDALKHYLEFSYGSVHRGAYDLSILSSQLYEDVRLQVAKFLGANVSAQQIIFTRGTTESLNILANGFSAKLLNENDRIVVPLSEHHANLVPWQQAALAKNCEIAYISLESLN